MLIRLRRFFAAPTFEGDEDKTRQAGVLNTILLAWLAGSVVMTTVVPFMGLGIVAWLVIGFLLNTMVVGLWFMTRHGLVRLVSMLCHLSWAFSLLFSPIPLVV